MSSVCPISFVRTFGGGSISRLVALASFSSLVIMREAPMRSPARLSALDLGERREACHEPRQSVFPALCSALHPSRPPSKTARGKGREAWAGLVDCYFYCSSDKDERGPHVPCPSPGIMASAPMASDRPGATPPVASHEGGLVDVMQQVTTYCWTSIGAGMGGAISGSKEKQMSYMFVVAARASNTAPGHIPAC